MGKAGRQWPRGRCDGTRNGRARSAQPTSNFAGLIFSTTSREAANASVLFGANLIGAMIGGFSEYLGMAVGSRHLALLVIALYAGSLLFLLANWRRAIAA